MQNRSGVGRRNLLEDATVYPASAEPDAIEERERAELVHKTLDALPEAQRSALVLTRFEGLSYEEAAEAMETTKPAVRSLITRAKLAMREALQRRLAAEL